MKRIVSAMSLGMFLLVGCAGSQLKKDEVVLQKDAAQLKADQEQLKKDQEQLKKDHQAIAQLRNRVAGEQMIINSLVPVLAAQDTLLDVLAKQFSTGPISVTIRKGQMVMMLNSDIMFAEGSTKITDKGKEVIAKVCGVLKPLKDKEFFVVGNTDNLPIANAKYPSNWELSTERAINVTKLMVQNGIDPTVLTPAGNAEFDPIAPNDTAENKQKNRRVDIVFIVQLPPAPPAVK